MERARRSAFLRVWAWVRVRWASVFEGGWGRDGGLADFLFALIEVAGGNVRLEQLGAGEAELMAEPEWRRL